MPIIWNLCLFETILYFPIFHDIDSWQQGRCLFFRVRGKQHNRLELRHWSIWIFYVSSGILSLIWTDVLHLCHRWRNTCHHYTQHFERFWVSLVLDHIGATEFLLVILAARFYSKITLWFLILITVQLQPLIQCWSRLLDPKRSSFCWNWMRSLSLNPTKKVFLLKKFKPGLYRNSKLLVAHFRKNRVEEDRTV